MAKKISLRQAGKIAVRCSSLPLFFSCPSALLNPDKLRPVRVENGSENLGTAIHEAIQHTIETGEMDLRRIEREFGPEDLDRARILYHNGLKVVEEARRDMKNPQFEIEVAFETEKYSVTGHIDLVDLHPDRAYVVDFKTGRTRDDHTHQMLGYAVGAWTRMGRPDKFTVHVAYVYLETNEVTNFDVDAADLKAWIKRLDGLVDQYVVNRRCVYCSLNNTCPAYRDYVKGSMEVLMLAGGHEGDAIPDVLKMKEEDRAKLATGIKMAQTAIERIRGHIKDRAIAKGEIPIGNGNKYTIRMKKHRLLLTPKALPVFAKFVTAKDIAKATTLSLNALTTAAMARAKGPMRGLIRTQLTEALEKAGAIITHETPELHTEYLKGPKWPTTKKTSKKK